MEQAELLSKKQHKHTFGQDKVRSGERKTLIVVIITALMMVVEIFVGIVFGSMALLADGIHMGSHMVGLMIALIAYILARKHADNENFSFGTGKVNSLAGFTSALLLVIFALVMGYESIMRFFNPVEINYNVAIWVAFIGLVVNGASMLILGEEGHTHAHGDHDHDHHGHDHHDHGHDHHDHAEHDHHDHAEHDHHDHDDHAHATHASGGDHNLKAAYLHVFTDALTSVFAIGALLLAKYFGWDWADPFMGLVGAILVVRWSITLVQSTGTILLDHQAPKETLSQLKGIMESYKDTKVADMHIWSIGPNIYSAEISVVTKYPESPDKYKTMIPSTMGVVHASVEVHVSE